MERPPVHNVNNILKNSDSSESFVPVMPLRVGWVLSDESLKRYGKTYGPLAIGLMEEQVSLTAIAPRKVSCESLPSPPMEIIAHERLTRWGIELNELDTLEESLREKQLHLLHALDARSAGAAHRLTKRLGIPLLISSYALGDVSHLSLLDSSTAVIASSQRVLDWMLQHHTAPLDRLFTASPGVYAAEKPRCFRQQEYYVSLVTGGLDSDHHAFETALKAMAILKHKEYPFFGFIVCDDRVERQIRPVARKLNLQNEVTFVERISSSHLADVLKAADIYICPQVKKQLNYGSLLAMSLGVPVIAARSEEPFLIEGQTVAAFPTGNENELARKIMKYMDDHALANRMAEQALAYLREHHRPSMMVNQVLDIYRTFLVRVKEPSLKSPVPKGAA